MGVFQAISRHFVEVVQLERADTIGLSTHVENKASIHIIEKRGFRKAASYIYLEVRRNAPVRNNGIPSGRVLEVMPEEAISFICSSGFLQAAHGHLPHGWKFYPFERDPKLVLSKMDHLLGIEEAGRLIGLLCVGESLRQEQDFTVDFIDGRADAVEELIRHALHLALGNRSVEMMIPKDKAGQAPAIPILEYLGFKVYNGFTPDVFLYERKP